MKHVMVQVSKACITDILSNQPTRWAFFTTKYPISMAKYVCDTCGWEYDPEVGYPEGGIEPGTAFEDLPDDFECPLCGVGKDQFSEA